ncbi:DNA polymerase III subunit gamma/tau [Actinosynnema sp. ALI-1.44]|uniref:DNA polymerase III subunit gamma and tau n=1 Tax=Actinosynnema sp. ALI-1.44 TaxID=1933779 RepID=UPI00097C3587|nr:DNA polymerase III subunit gamma and tau [Actinosynnema sp. ALI-1.44]ONI79039.1 DNA polymerase III subunit gamma/tau [Actinosynnema sp. ALI-1.44]
MALALYRKYRPATFAEVVGQEHVTDPLRIALSAGRVNHAYLFSGPRGCGKTSSARIMARSLNCVQGPTPDPCGECESCVSLAPNGPGSVDVVELDAASHGGVDDTRELRDRAFFAPAISRYRIFIIDEAHMVTTQGFNALLKIVEEPPEHLIFIFATTEPDKVLTTIRSRTHHYPFRLIPPGIMRELLERNCAAEGVAVEPSVFPLVIRAGGGSARDTQSVMDQLLSGAGADGVTYERAVSLLGVTDIALINDMVDGLATGDAAAVYGTIERLVDAGHDPRRFASDLLDRLRDLVLLSAVPDSGARGLVNVPDDELSRMSAQADRLGPATLSRFAEIVHTGLIEMRGATSPRLVMELLCARMLLPAAVPSDPALDSAVLQRLEQLEKRASVAPIAAAAVPALAQQAAPAPTQAPTPAAAPVQQPQRQPEPVPVAAAPVHQAPPPAAAPAAPAEPGVMDAAALRRIWPELLAEVRRQPGGRSTEAMLTNATVQSIEGDMVVIAHAAAPLARRLGEARNVDLISTALNNVIGGKWRITCVHGSASAAPQAAQAPPQPRPQPTRPSQAAAPPPPQRQAPRPATDHDDIPPPEPPEPDDPLPPPAPPPPPPKTEAEEEEEMLVEASQKPGEGERIVARDPEEVAIELLTQELGAKKI